MAANGKVAVDKLKIGATVAIKLKDSGSCEGAVYTVDPVTKTVVLFSAAEKPVTQDSRDVRLVPEHAIDSIKVVKQHVNKKNDAQKKCLRWSTNFSRTCFYIVFHAEFSRGNERVHYFDV